MLPEINNPTNTLVACENQVTEVHAQQLWKTPERAYLNTARGFGCDHLQTSTRRNSPSLRHELINNLQHGRFAFGILVVYSRFFRLGTIQEALSCTEFFLR